MYQLKVVAFGTEFNATGTLKNYDASGRLSRIKVPVLYTCGEYDESTPNANAYLNFGGGINVVDPNSGATRQSTKADLAASARLCDALKEVSVYSRAVYPLDQPQKVLHLHTAEACFNNTAKPFLNSPESKWEVEKIIKILQTHQPEPLPDGAAERIRSIVEEAEKEVGVK